MMLLRIADDNTLRWTWDFSASRIIAGFHTTKLDYSNDSCRKTVHEYIITLFYDETELERSLCQRVPSSAINAFVGKKKMVVEKELLGTSAHFSLYDKIKMYYSLLRQIYFVLTKL